LLSYFGLKTGKTPGSPQSGGRLTIVNRAGRSIVRADVAIAMVASTLCLMQ
jgi:hypothetical protein